MVTIKTKSIITILLFISSVIVTSCFIPNDYKIHRLSQIKYGDCDNTEKELCFYTPLGEGYDEDLKLNVRFQNILFYPDQTVCFFHINRDSLQFHDVHTSLADCVYKWGKKKEWGYEWGVYNKQGNYIYAELYGKELMFYLSWKCSKYVFYLDGDTLTKRKLIAYDYSCKESFQQEYPDDVEYKYIRVPINEFPPQSNNFLKKESWIWKNTDDWEEWMEHQQKQETEKKKNKNKLSYKIEYDD